MTLSATQDRGWGCLEPQKTTCKKFFSFWYVTLIEEVKNMIDCMPFLLFDGNCAEAMTFYHKCLGGELELTKLGDTPMKTQFPPEKHNRMINAVLKSGAIEISATD